MGFLGFGSKSETHLLVVIFEGSERLRVHGNLIRKSALAKKNAAAHPQAVCWAEFTTEGARQDGGAGPLALRLGPGESERLQRELPQLATCKAILNDLRQGKESSSKWLPWGKSAETAKNGARS